VKPGYSALALAMVFLGCASMPRPAVVEEADRVAETPAAAEAHELAPQAHAHALALRDRADAAYRAGDLAGAQILGEHSIAAMNRAFVLTRLVKAQRRLDAANAKLAKNQQKLAELDEQAQRITAEADNLELRVKVLRDAQPLVTPAAATPERERARASAARALLSQARLLCLSTRLLEPKRGNVGQQLTAIDGLEASVARDPSVDVNAATKLRSACLKELTLVRRPQLLDAPAEGLTDTLLDALTKTEKFYAFRDDRGVVVVLRDVLTAQGTPTAAGAEQLEALARVAKAHPKFPVLVVTHSASAAGNNTRDLDAVVGFLKDKGAPSVQGHAAGDAQPVAPPKRPGARERNTRTEIVFVSPSS